MTADARNPILLPGKVYEVRAPKTRQGVISGYFDDAELLYRATQELDGKVPGVYMTMNPTISALLARAKNRTQTHTKITTSDADIQQRCWVLVDVDAKRPAEISSSESEHQAALHCCRTIASWLTEQGWPDPVRADSGNGGHLLYRIDLPNTAENTALVKACLEVLALKFNDNVVTIDTTVYNAARITKIYGTMACKGDSTDDRPHRRSQILAVPITITPVQTPLLQALAQRLPVDQKPVYSGTNANRFDLQNFIVKHGLIVNREVPWNSGRMFVLDACPFNLDHRQDSSIIQFPSGAISFQCFHNSCQSHHWQQLRDLLEPNRARHTSASTPSPAGHHAPAQAFEQCQSEEVIPDGPVLIPLASVQPEVVRFLWPGRIAVGKLNTFVGDPGLGKSYVTLDVTARVTRGDTWPDGGRAPQGHVVILSAEDGIADTIRPRLDRLGADPHCVSILTAVRRSGEEKAFCLSQDLLHLEAAITQTRAVMVVIDPLSAYLGQIESNSDSDVRGIMNPLAALAERTGTAIVSVMHLNKSAQSKALYRALGSIAFVASARVVLCVAADPDDPTERRFLGPLKANICAAAPVLAFSMAQGHLTWESQAVHGVSMEEVLGASSAAADRQRTSKADAVEWLRAELRDGEQPQSEVIRHAQSNSISESTIRRASKILGVKARRVGFGTEGQWRWALPHTCSDERLWSKPAPDAASSIDGQPVPSDHLSAPIDGHIHGQEGTQTAFGPSLDISTTYIERETIDGQKMCEREVNCVD